MSVLEINGLYHRFDKNNNVIKGLHMRVPRGSIYGFLGPNGAGKTTTLRLILGLIKTQEGQINIFGKPFHENRLEILKQVGSLIDSPSYYGHLTAAENMQVFQKLYQCPRERIGEVLNLVGLARTGAKKAAHFSLGMKQRLGIAIALLHSPKLLVLDEPTNGLDPNGMIEIREMLKDLNRVHGISIVVSSHLLSEMEKLVSHVGIINQGQLVYEGTLDQLMTRRRELPRVTFETDDAAKAMGILDGRYASENLHDNRLRIAISTKSQIGTITRELVEAGIMIYGINAMNQDLESIFIDFINQ